MGWNNKGVALYNLGEYDEAVQAYDEAIRLDPEFAIAWNNKGLALRNLGEYDEAVQAYDEAIRLDPEFAIAWNNKGLALYNLGEYAEAVQAYDEAIRIDPEYALAWYSKGLALYNLGEYAEAVQAYDEAIRIDPEYALAWYSKGLALYNLGEYAKAIRSYDEATRIDPEYALAWYSKGLALYNLGEYYEAVQAYDEAIRLDPEFAIAWNNKGLALYNLGEYAEAVQAYDEAIRIDPEYALAWYNKGISLRNLGKYVDANLAIDEAVRLGSVYTPPWYFSISAPTVQSLEDLARGLSGPGDDDDERARAIYRWIITNIKYEVSDANAGVAGNRTPDRMLEERRGICIEYSRLFAKLCQLSGLEAVVITGHGKGSGYSVGSNIPDSANHAWNAVRIDGTWCLVDATWGSGSIDPEEKFVGDLEEFYFLTAPEKLVWTHLPDHQSWQLLDEPLSKAEFEALPYPKAAFFNNQISILDPIKGTIDYDGEASVNLSAPEDVVFIAALLDERGVKLPDRRFTQVQRSEDAVIIRAETPGPGNYTLRIYSKRSGRLEGPYDWTLDYRIAAGRNAPTGIGFPVIRDGFWEMGLGAKSHPQGLIKAGAEVEVAFSAPEGVLLLARLFDREGLKLSENRTFAQREGEDYVVKAAFPVPGEYTLRIYGKRLGDPGGEYAPMLEYDVVAGGGGENIGYPRTLGAFIEVGGRLVAPMEGMLPTGDHEFELLVPGAEGVAIINDGSWTHLTGEGERFWGEATLSRGEARVAARFGEGSTYNVLFLYSVV
ncbi:tetratricopeptide repeat protein [Candidatus Methanocrinis natronophilus]|uniref:Tetratricopeptide repeat protein n=1 Tax=Candidatus Methanocrinis natronophilus TaxID=3033396 RepID=A0ABT5X4S3_9EURY|nr:tetratricopeptide repeat protein [Candidatus Methanocrinis natronophilus]MDF0589688.1 tetratricopeptide repeat protein [Candidatus Methanocrinis natronophilus]